MNTKKISLLVGLVISVCLSTTFAKAASIQISSTEVIFNFDFTALDPNPPYTNIYFGAIFDESDPVVGTDSMLTKIYGELNGTEIVQTRNDTLTGDGTIYGPLLTANSLFDPMLDGIFSIGLQMNSGTADLVDFTAYGVINGVIGPSISHPVPLPATGILFISGLFGFGLVKYRRNNNSLGIKRRTSINLMSC